MKENKQLTNIAFHSCHNFVIVSADDWEHCWGKISVLWNICSCHSHLFTLPLPPSWNIFDVKNRNCARMKKWNHRMMASRIREGGRVKKMRIFNGICVEGGEGVSGANKCFFLHFLFCLKTIYNHSRLPKFVLRIVWALKYVYINVVVEVILIRLNMPVGGRSSQRMSILNQ